MYWELHTINRTETTDCASCWAAHPRISYRSATHHSCMQHSCPLFLPSGKAKQPQDSNIHSWKRGSEKPEQHASHRICQRFNHKFTHQQPPRTINNLCILYLKAFWWMKAGLVGQRPKGKGRKRHIIFFLYSSNRLLHCPCCCVWFLPSCLIFLLCIKDYSRFSPPISLIPCERHFQKPLLLFTPPTHPVALQPSWHCF